MDPDQSVVEIAKMDLEEEGRSKTVPGWELGFQDMTKRFGIDLRVLQVHLHVRKRLNECRKNTGQERVGSSQSKLRA